ncbi:citrate lyase subunit beta [Anaerosporomusa subterranea]|uniref:Citrate lyase subunit beta n=1 Tax=Anaerosporomusa subterranea TaxID=1794912 RepID=A0A154BN34_ANASB|nr:aldolase/citrate lyase family protein [Anaerosporomusa subterranea]KYZ75295.1 citrate lyase subunit beta [Anaerosporomusa subterranea]
MAEERLRRSVMYAAGNNPGLLQNAGIYGADSVIFDVEDSVSVGEKDSARELVYNALKYLKFSCEIGVRINHISTPWGYDDLDYLLPAKPDYIRLPKGESGDEIRDIDKIITKAEEEYGFEPGTIKIMVSIESPKGLRNAYEIASASPRMIAIAIGGEDFATSLKTEKTKGNAITGGRELFVARSMIVFAAREAGIQAIDSVFSDLRDEQTFLAEVELAKELGFDGKSCVNPRQIDIIHQVYTPSEKEIDYAHRVLAAYKDALTKNSGVIALNGKMIDAPMVIRAERVLANARSAGVYQKEEIE